MAPTLVFNTQFDAQADTPLGIAPGLLRVTAPNANAYTFTGTNSFLVGHQRLALIDPGPDDAHHLAALERACAGRRVDAVILTHTHRDHSAGARQASEKFSAPLWFGGPHRLSRPLQSFERNHLRNSCDWDLIPDRTLLDGETIQAGDLELKVHATPGHCANHMAFGLDDLLLTGDHVMGWNSTLVAVPDGSMADYLASLDKVIALPYRRYVPAHGGDISDGPNHARALKQHRLDRNAQVLAAVQHGARTVRAIVRQIYPNQRLPVRRAARMTITAHAEYLSDQGQLTLKRTPFGLRISA